MTKLEATRSRAEATLNDDLQILDDALGAVDTRLDALEAGGGGGAPSGPAGGDLTGSYPNPQIGAGVIVDADVATANKDGLAAVPSLRTLGTGAQQATAGNDGRLTNARVPTAHASTHQPGGADAMTVDAAAATGSLRTLGTGAQQAAPGNDARFGSGGPPTGAASGHLTGTYPGPSIANGVVTDSHVAIANKDGAVGTASMRTIGAGATQAAAGNHAHASYVSNPMTAVADLIVGGASGTPTRLGVGASSQVLTVVGGVLQWATPASGGMTNPMTAVGDVIIGGASGAPSRLAAGSTDYILTMQGGSPVWKSTATVQGLQVNGNATVTGYLKISANSAVPGGVAGGVYKMAANGLTRKGVPGSTNDLILLTPLETTLLRNPTGTTDLIIPGNLTVSGTLTSTHATTHQPGGADPMAVDAAAGTGSLRTLGAGATQAAGGTHTHGAAAPAAHATTHQPGGSDAMAVDAAAGTGSLRTIGSGALTAAAGNHTHGAAAPAAHATTHQPGGSDAMAVDAAAATGSLRTLGTSATSAAAGNDARLSDARTPTLHATSHQPGGADALAVDAAAGTGSLRTLSTTATSAAAGNHAHAAYVTNPMTTAADLIVGGASGAPTRLGVGAATQVLTVVGGVLTWATPASGFANPMTTLGDLITGGASGAPGRLGVGTTDQVLSMVAGAPAWAAPQATETQLTDGGMEVWQRGNGPFTATNAYTADRWQLVLGGTSTATVTRETTVIADASAASLKCVYVHGSAVSRIEQAIEHYAQITPRTIAFAIRVYQQTAGSIVRAFVDVSGARTYSATQAGTGSFLYFAVSVSLGGLTGLKVGVELSGSGTVYLDNAIAVVSGASGDTLTAPPYRPLHPAEDLARCQRYYETLGGGATQEHFAMLQAWATTRANGVLAFKVPKAITPTVTFSTASTVAVQNAAATLLAATVVAASQITPRSCDVDVTVASGLVAGNAALWLANSTTSALISIEGNP